MFKGVAFYTQALLLSKWCVAGLQGLPRSQNCDNNNNNTLPKLCDRLSNTVATTATRWLPRHSHCLPVMASLNHNKNNNEWLTGTKNTPVQCCTTTTATAMAA